MDKVQTIIKELLPAENFDAIAVGVIDFQAKKFHSLEMVKTESGPEKSPLAYYYDLASVTKPLVNSLSYFLKPDSFDERMLQCLSHRGGLPAWGLLSQRDWKELILGYPIKESETLYSDFSALRVMLELEKKGIQQKKICTTIWDKELMHWLDLPQNVPLLQYGYRNSLPNYGQVHDPNAWVLNTFCSHAGLFSTIKGICQTLINYQEETDFILKVKTDLQKHSHRFALGWDRVENLKTSLAGLGCGPGTFGHLGFTGTSVWIDPEKMLGQVILTNATKHYWYDKQGLNEIRRSIGTLVWSREVK